MVFWIAGFGGYDAGALAAICKVDHADQGHAGQVHSIRRPERRSSAGTAQRGAARGDGLPADQPPLVADGLRCLRHDLCSSGRFSVERSGPASGGLSRGGRRGPPATGQRVTPVCSEAEKHKHRTALPPPLRPLLPHPRCPPVCRLLPQDDAVGALPDGTRPRPLAPARPLPQRPPATRPAHPLCSGRLSCLQSLRGSCVPSCSAAREIFLK